MGVLTSTFNFKARPSLRVAAAVDQAASDDCKCPICQEMVGIETADGIVEAWSTIPCGHRFGSFCIKTWLGLADQPACPICRRDMVHSCGHPVLPIPSLSGKKRKSIGGIGGGASVGVVGPLRRKRKQPVLASTCPYCTKARWKSPRRGIVGRAVVRALRVVVADRFKERLDRMYWEVWRQNHSREFGAWWAAQEPTTEPAKAAPDQGWIFLPRD